MLVVSKARAAPSTSWREEMTLNHHIMQLKPLPLPMPGADMNVHARELELQRQVVSAVLILLLRNQRSELALQIVFSAAATEHGCSLLLTVIRICVETTHRDLL